MSQVRLFLLFTHILTPFFTTRMHRYFQPLDRRTWTKSKSKSGCLKKKFSSTLSWNDQKNTNLKTAYSVLHCQYRKELIKSKQILAFIDFICVFDRQSKHEHETVVLGSNWICQNQNAKPKPQNRYRGLNFATFLEFSYSCLSFKFSIFVILALIHNRTDLKLFRMQHWNFNEFAKK
jgi:hypothetical protein